MNAILAHPACAAWGSHADAGASRGQGIVPLTDAQLDEVAGGLGVMVAVGGSAGGSGPSVDALVCLMARPNVATRHVFVMSRGIDPTSYALVTLAGDNTHSESHSVTTPSGISISQSNGVVH